MSEREVITPGWLPALPVGWEELQFGIADSLI